MEQVVTADDIVRSGACHTGVMEVVNRLRNVAAAMPVGALMAKLSVEEREYVVKAAELDGYGDGDGDYGNGSGYGDGDGGNSYGNGYGNGYGDGNGYGNGYGDGDGGYGDGDGGYGGNGDG